MFNLIFSDSLQNDISKIIQREVSRADYEPNETNGHLQKLRKDRVNGAVKLYLSELGFKTIHLKIGSTVECFFYDEKNEIVINIMKECAFQSAKQRNTHYLRDISRINDNLDKGQMFLFQDNRGIIELIYADSRLAKLYNKLGNSNISNFYTIIFKHSGNNLHEVGFYQFKSDLSTMYNSIIIPDESYDSVMEIPNITVSTEKVMPSRNLKLKVNMSNLNLNKTHLFKEESTEKILK